LLSNMENNVWHFFSAGQHFWPYLALHSNLSQKIFYWS
jgi:hypothetical protein